LPSPFPLWRVLSVAYADDDENKDGPEKEEGLLSESHELFSNLLLLFVGMHVMYIVLFKLPLAKFMLFVPKGDSKK